MEEIWKDIIGFENYYQISNFGRIKSLSYNKAGFEKVLKLNKSPFYYQILLCAEGVRKSIKVHRLVAIHFIPNPENKKEVNHKDFDKLNNHVDNLEWVTPKENSRHAYNAGKTHPPHFYGEKNTSSKLTQLQVDDIRKEHTNKRGSMAFLSKKYNVSKTNISCIINRKIWV